MHDHILPEEDMGMQSIASQVGQHYKNQLDKIEFQILQLTVY